MNSSLCIINLRKLGKAISWWTGVVIPLPSLSQLAADLEIHPELLPPSNPYHTLQLLLNTASQL